MSRETQEASAPITSKSIFQEDVVCLASNRDKFGLVIQNALDSEDESDSEDEERITEGHVLVSWYPKGIEEEIEERMVRMKLPPKRYPQSPKINERHVDGIKFRHYWNCQHTCQVKKSSVYSMYAQHQRLNNRSIENCFSMLEIFGVLPILHGMKPGKASPQCQLKSPHILPL